MEFSIGTWVIPTLICVGIYLGGYFFIPNESTGDYSRGADAFLRLFILAIQLVLMLIVWLIWALA